MGRVGRPRERRVLRRAADQALTIPTFQQPVDVAPAQESSAPLAYEPGDYDFDDRWVDPGDSEGWFGHVGVAESASLGVDELLRDRPDDNWRDDRDEIPRDGRHQPPLGDSRLGTPDNVAPAHEGFAPLADARGDDDFDGRWADPGDSEGWFRHVGVAESASLGVDELLRDRPDDNWRDDPDETPRDGGHWPRLGDSRLGVPNNSVLADISVLTTPYRPRPWYRTKQVVTGLAAAAVAAMVVGGVLLAVRSPATGAEESTVAPQASTTPRPAPTSAQPTPTSVPPTGPSAPMPPPAPPPPAPATAAQIDPAPVVTRQNPWPRPAAPSQAEKPEIGVTRAPATRSPMSAAPQPRPAPGTNSATPGDGPKRRGGWHF